MSRRLPRRGPLCSMRPRPGRTPSSTNRVLRATARDAWLSTSASSPIRVSPHPSNPTDRARARLVWRRPPLTGLPLRPPFADDVFAVGEVVEPLGVLGGQVEPPLHLRVGVPSHHDRCVCKAKRRERNAVVPKCGLWPHV